MSAPYTLYGTPFSLYSGKARAYLDFKQIPYQEQYATVGVYKKVIVPETGMKMIPVVKTPDGTFLQDTAVIIEALEKAHPERPVVPQTPRQKLVSYLFELWADEWLLLPAMHYRWKENNASFIYREFGRVISPYLPGFLRAVLGKKIANRFKGFVPVLGINERSIPDIEDWYENHVLHHLNQHFAAHNYVLGDCPSLADVSLMGPLYAHLFRDQAPGELMKKLAPHVVKWIERMQQKDAAHSQWLENDGIPQTLFPLLQRMFKEQWPVLLNTVLEVEEWSNAYPDEKNVPRSIGTHTFELNDNKHSRAILSFAQWKLQRVLDVYQSFSDEEKVSVDELVKDLEGSDYLNFKVTHPLERINGRLSFAE